MKLDDFAFQLPPELIAQQPASERGGSRLLVIHEANRANTNTTNTTNTKNNIKTTANPVGNNETANTVVLADRHFADLPQLLQPNDLLIFNDSRVIKARFFGHKNTGGKIEIFLEQIHDAIHASARIRASKAPSRGSYIFIDGISMAIEVLGRCGNDDEFYALCLPTDSPQNWWQLSELYGQLPLPPYITHPATPEDEQRYQTVYAKNPGAVAAPTAGLHFDDAMLAKLNACGVQTAFLTLHVGSGTYQPVRCDDIADHHMHSEHFIIPTTLPDTIAQTRARGGRVIAVGTTSLRALESAADANHPGNVHAQSADTSIFITPGYRFRVVDALITNFHLPKSTLLMLVSAFVGMDAIHEAYQHAISERYRFFSYGDAMFLPCRHRA